MNMTSSIAAIMMELLMFALCWGVIVSVTFVTLCDEDGLPMTRYLNIVSLSARKTIVGGMVNAMTKKTAATIKTRILCIKLPISLFLFEVISFKKRRVESQALL